MNNLINNDYLGITNLNSIYADTGNIDTFSCKSLTIGGTDYTSYNNNLQNQITTLQSTDVSLQTQINQKVNTSDYGTFNGDVILNQSNTYLSGDTTNFTIKNKYPIYTPVYTQNPLIVDSNLLYFYTFNNSDLSGGYLKNQATNNYDLLIESNVIVDGTLNIPYLTSDSVASKITSQIIFNTNFSIGGWIYLENLGGSRIFFTSNGSTQNDSLQIFYDSQGRIFLLISNFISGTGIVYTQIATTYIISINAWNFFTWVVEGTTWTFYYNGNKTTYLNKVNMIVKNKNNSFIGRFLTNNQNINGKIDNFFIYNNLLSDSQINSIFQATQSPNLLNVYHTIPIQPITTYISSYDTTYGYTPLMSLDNSGYITNNPTITNLQTIDTSLQSQINNIISSSAGDVKTITIGNTSTLDSGDSAYVLNVGTSQNMILNFGIPRGYRGFSGSDGSSGSKGDKGDTGEKGDRGSDGSSVGIETVIGIIESIFTQLEIAGLQAEIALIQGQVSAIQLQITGINENLGILNLKTQYQSSALLSNNTRFSSKIQIMSNDSIPVQNISLNQDGSITSYGKLLCNGEIEGAKLISNSDIQGNRLMSSGDILGTRLLINDINNITTTSTNIHGLNVNIGDVNVLGIPSTLTTNISGSVINIGTSSASIINIGGGLLSAINLNGVVNTYGVFGFQTINGYFTQFQ